MTDIVLLKNATEVGTFGGKAVNLAKLLNAGLPVPNGFAVGLGAFGPDGKLFAGAKEEISKLTKDQPYAVRSSATAEDAENSSWAGQFETFLNVKPSDLISNIEKCHASAKIRAKSYADQKGEKAVFQVAAVVQEMLNPEYAGVLFTKDPISGESKFATEYIEGLGEELVSGRADPKQISWQKDKMPDAPFDVKQLSELAKKTEKLFGEPQDIEWVWADNKIWLVQARPITTKGGINNGYYLGEPDDLFYWGPSRAKPLYMSDYMQAVENFLLESSFHKNLPKPPKTLVLFHEGKMVWLNNAHAFVEFVEKVFEAYELKNRIEEDIKAWQNSIEILPTLKGEHFKKELLKAWKLTLFAEFSLYGADSVITRRLSRFDVATRQKIFGTFTIPDKQTFLTRIDEELLESKDPQSLSKKYPWINDGYDGVHDTAESYFADRLKILLQDNTNSHLSKPDKSALEHEFSLSGEEIKVLTLTRRLAEFMDDRKEWMMKTRRLIEEFSIYIEHGWMLDDGKASKIDEANTTDLWQRYINFKGSTNAVTGIVASNGGRHFVTGEIVIVSGPTDTVASGMILVVPSTSPSYVPLMRSAKALITDHGGMMSHAAIVAREFGLPCIVGTKHATKVLKTGDKVVLDLVKGEVNR
ncbi:MAG TPA: PEP/pyruvate-binding domain-containing protein [Patescibacteria group bacterium]|nr:PEP/pyruvate-binding domain-containing protein [Patescibacteria group bacterium]